MSFRTGGSFRTSGFHVDFDDMEAEVNQPAIAAASSTAKCSASQMRTRPSLAPDPLRLDGLPENGFSDKVIAILRKAKTQFIQHPAPA